MTQKESVKNVPKTQRDNLIISCDIDQLAKTNEIQGTSTRNLNRMSSILDNYYTNQNIETNPNEKANTFKRTNSTKAKPPQTPIPKSTNMLNKRNSVCEYNTRDHQPLKKNNNK